MERTPEPVRRLAEVFAAEGKSLHLVGGYVRDLLRGENPDDVDAATDARPAEIKRLLRAGGADSLWEVGERFGTVGATIGGFDVEVTTYRSEEYDPGSRKPKVTFGDSLYDDLDRRDLTINAVALDPRSGALVDPHGGTEDLERGIIRAVGDPDARLQEDPLRMMRAVRFSARFGFPMDADLKDAISRNAPKLDTVSRERIRQELDKALKSGSPPSHALEAMRETGLLGRVLPEVADTVGVTQEGPHHDSDVYGHTLKVADALPAEAPLRLKLAAILHDTGKPETKTLTPSGRATFFGHEEVSAEKAKAALERLRYDRETVDTVSHLCREHMRPMALHNAGKAQGYSNGAVRRFMVRAHLARGDKILADVSDLLELNRADILGHSGQGKASPGGAGESQGGTGHERDLARWGELRSRVREQSSETDGAGNPLGSPEFADSPLDGGELMSHFGGSPGKWVGEVKAHLKGLVVDGVLQPADKAAARERAAVFLGSRNHV